jgi:nucleoside-diphosphate-sugar epimerase
MRIVITGGAGFLGQRLAEQILETGHIVLPHGGRVAEPDIVLADMPGTSVGEALAGGVRFEPLDIRDADAVRRVIGDDTGAVFHLAAVVSAAAEADFDLGMSVNLDGTRNVLEAARALKEPIPLISTSSLAVFGGVLPPRLSDAQAVQPENSYGAQKAIGELLCGDYRRKGFCDARTLRLPTIVIRPGKPNAAASSFASSILREPLGGQEAVCPVARDLKLWIGSPEAAIGGMLHALSVAPEAWPKFGTINLPGLASSVDEMLAALEREAGRDAARLVRFEPDERIERIVGSWPSDFDTDTAEALGFAADRTVEGLIESYAARYLPG